MQHTRAPLIAPSGGVLSAGAVEEVADGIVSHGLLGTLLVSALLYVSLLALGGLILAIHGDQLLRHASDADGDG